MTRNESRGQKQRIAVIGSGAAGSTCAWLLSRHHEVTVYEKENRLGGHTCTLTVPEGRDEGMPVDVGFIVMNHRNYPVLTQILKQLEIPLEDSDMSFSYTDPDRNVSYAGSTLKSLFARPGSWRSMSHLKMIRDILRFNRRAIEDLDRDQLTGRTLGEYVHQIGLGREFRERYLYPMGSAIWSSPESDVASFPAQTYIQFFKNHGLLELKNRPQWRFVRGGSVSYIEEMKKTFHAAHCGAEIQSVDRSGDDVTFRFTDGGEEVFDAVVFAVHADQVLTLLGDPSPDEQASFTPWTYQNNDITLHTDVSVMPEEKGAWASWNVMRPPGDNESSSVCVTYHMNRLQNLPSETDYFVSLNMTDRLDPKKVIARKSFAHPVYSENALATQSKLPMLNGQRNTWFCGSYFGYGFHEDAVRSANDVAKGFKCNL